MHARTSRWPFDTQSLWTMQKDQENPEGAGAEEEERKKESAVVPCTLELDPPASFSGNTSGVLSVITTQVITQETYQQLIIRLWLSGLP